MTETTTRPRSRRRLSNWFWLLAITGAINLACGIFALTAGMAYGGLNVGIAAVLFACAVSEFRNPV